MYKFYIEYTQIIQISISRDWSYWTVGMTELINFKKIISAICGFIFLFFALDSYTNLFITYECLHGWIVNILTSRYGIFYSVTV